MNLTGAKEDRNQKKECQMCQKNQDLDACFNYKKLQVDERKKFLVRSKLFSVAMMLQVKSTVDETAQKE